MIDVSITTDTGEEYEEQDGDEIIFRVKKTFQNSIVLIEQRIEEEQIILLPDDTLDLAFGKYVYDIKLHTVNAVYTIINGAFEVTEGTI